MGYKILKITAKIMEGVGFMSMMLGGAGMDNDSILLPLIMAFGGIGIMVAGCQIDEIIA